MADDDNINVDENTMDMTSVIEDTNNDGEITVDDLTYKNYLDAGWTDEQLLKDERLKGLVPISIQPEIEIPEEPAEEVKPEGDWLPIVASIVKKAKAFVLLKTKEGEMIRVFSNDFKQNGKKLFTRVDCPVKVIKPIKKNWARPKK